MSRNGLVRKSGAIPSGTAASEDPGIRWLFWDNHKLTSYMATYRFQRAFTPSSDPNALKFLKDRLDQFLDILEKHPARQSFVVGERPTAGRSLGKCVSPIPERRWIPNCSRSSRPPKRPYHAASRSRSGAV
jgi:hypothetical protein